MFTSLCQCCYLESVSLVNPAIGLTGPDDAQGQGAVVSLRSLRQLYLIIPFTALIVAVDLLGFGGRLRDGLDNSPQDYLALALIFGTPHIVASNLILFTNQDYLNHYKGQLLRISLGIAAFFVAFGLWLPYEVMFALIAGWTVTHVVKQQLGIGNIVSRASGVTYWVWLTTGIAAGVCYYLAIFLPRYLSDGTISLLGALSALLAAITAGATAILWSQCTTVEGRRWIVANGATMVGSVLMFLAGYPLFAILIPRFLHDLTAFTFYVSHDRNRALSGHRSWLYRVVPNGKVWWLLGLPLIAIGLSAALEHGGDTIVNGVLDSAFGVRIDRPVSLGVVGFLALLHYAFESFTWKRSSPYQSFVNLRID